MVAASAQSRQEAATLLCQHAAGAAQAPAHLQQVGDPELTEALASTHLNLLAPEHTRCLSPSPSRPLQAQYDGSYIESPGRQNGLGAAAPASLSLHRHEPASTAGVMPLRPRAAHLRAPRLALWSGWEPKQPSCPPQQGAPPGGPQTSLAGQRQLQVPPRDGPTCWAPAAYGVRRQGLSLPDAGCSGALLQPTEAFPCLQWLPCILLVLQAARAHLARAGQRCLLACPRRGGCVAACPTCGGQVATAATTTGSCCCCWGRAAQDGLFPVLLLQAEKVKSCNQSTYILILQAQC